MQAPALKACITRTEFRRLAPHVQQCMGDDEPLRRRFDSQPVVIYHRLATPLADVGCQVRGTAAA